MCVGVCLEGVHQECGKHISNVQINASLMFPHSWSRIQMVCAFSCSGGSSSRMRKTHAEGCGKHISESSAIIDNLFLWKYISSYLIYSLR